MTNNQLEEIGYVLKRVVSIAVKPDNFTVKEHKQSLEDLKQWAQQVLTYLEYSK